MKMLFFFFILLLALPSFGQDYIYEPSAEFPYGRLNPEAPPEMGQWAEFIGSCNCKSVSRIDQNTWADTVDMVWIFRYIMNGTAIEDITLKADGKHSGNIRQYNADSARWYVHYFSSSVASPTLGTWAGNREGDKFTLYKSQPSPNGYDGFFKIVLSDILEAGFNWEGAWVSVDESIVYPTWRIYCVKDED